MKIENAIMSVNDNPLYQRWWPLTAELWHTMGVKPKLYWVSDGEEDFPFPSPYGTIEKVPILHMGIGREGGGSNDSFFCSMWARIYGCAATPGINIGTDIDVFPIDKKYFVDNVKGFRDTQIIHLSYEIGYMPHISHLPPYCYYVTRNDVYTEMMLLQSKFMKGQVTWDDDFARDMAESTDNDPERKYNDEAYMLRKVRDYGIMHQEDLHAIILLTRSRGRVYTKDLRDESQWLNLIRYNPDAHFFLSSGEPFDFHQAEKFQIVVKEHLCENR